VHAARSSDDDADDEDDASDRRQRHLAGEHGQHTREFKASTLLGAINHHITIAGYSWYSIVETVS